VTVDVLLPTDVVNDPTGMVFVPLKRPVTTTETEHDAAGGMTVPDDSVKELSPGVAVTVPLTQVVVANGPDELLIPVG
jgi:hypothetical protein